MYHPKHGKDFLCNYYAILGVDRTATLDEITVAFRTLQKQNLPDLTVGLAKDLQNQAKSKSEVLSEAWSTLRYPERRAAYDQLLENWDGPLSSDGLPVVELHRSSLHALLQFDDDRWGELSAKIEQLSGYDPDTFELLQEQYQRSDLPSQKLTDAYVNALHRRLSNLTVKEEHLLRVLGSSLDNHLASIEGHVEKVEQAIAARHEELLAIAAGTAPGMMLPIGESIAQLQEEAKVAVQHALITYEQVSAQALQVSQERQDIVQQLMSVKELRLYQPLQVQMFPQVFVGLDFGVAIYWHLFRISGNEALMDVDSFSQEEMLALSDPARAQAMIDQGFNVLLVQHQDGIEIMDQVTAAVQSHFERLNA